MAPVLFYQFILKPVTTPAYLILRGDLLVEYATVWVKKKVYSKVFSYSNFNGIALKGESILHFLVLRNQIFPNMQIINRI